MIEELTFALTEMLRTDNPPADDLLKGARLKLEQDVDNFANAVKTEIGKQFLTACTIYYAKALQGDAHTLANKMLAELTESPETLKLNMEMVLCNDEKEPKEKAAETSCAKIATRTQI